MRDDEIFDWSNDIRNGEKLRTLKYILEVMVISLIGALEGENSMISILNNRMYKDICVCVCVCFLLTNWVSYNSVKFWYRLPWR